MFDFYIGVDQTGAVRRSRHGHHYKPLPAVVVQKRNDGVVELRALDRHGKALKLPAFTPAAIRLLLRENDLADRQHQKKEADVAVLVDSVLGLPYAKNLHPFQLRDFFYKAATHEKNSKEKPGRERAADFFDGLLRQYYKPTPSLGTAPFPRRICEAISGSNSVFQKHPFQKNIQSGTYRIWCDLGHALIPGEDLTAEPSIWPHDHLQATRTASKSMIIAEGYPSFYWRHLFSAPSRQPLNIESLTIHEFEKRKLKLACDSWQVLKKDPDAADAAILALSAFLLDLNHELFPDLRESPAARQSRQLSQILVEGWIVAVTPRAKTEEN
ncbi:MAG: hypothetical protein RIQ81_1541 [Pseudomonadota bacterium]|jgi:hypothetical protein